MPLDPNPQSVPVALTQWGAFRLAMLTNPAYLRVSKLTSAQQVVTRLEMYFATEAENWPIASVLWGQMMTGCPIASKPTAEEAGGWSAIAEKANMPFYFSESGDFQIKK